MIKRLSLITGVLGASLSLLLNLFFIVLSIYALTLTDNVYYNLFDGYATHSLFIGIALAIASFVALAGSLYVRESPVTAGLVMILYGVIAFTFGLSTPLLGPRWLAKIPSVLLIVAGILALISRFTVSSGSNETNDTDSKGF